MIATDIDSRLWLAKRVGSYLHFHTFHAHCKHLVELDIGPPHANVYNVLPYDTYRLTSVSIYFVGS